MIKPLFVRTLTAQEIARHALLVPGEVAEAVRASVESHPEPRCARVEHEARAVRLIPGADGGPEAGEPAARWWLENALPHGAREGDIIVVHEGAEEYCLVVALQGR